MPDERVPTLLESGPRRREALVRVQQLPVEHLTAQLHLNHPPAPAAVAVRRERIALAAPTSHNHPARRFDAGGRGRSAVTRCVMAEVARRRSWSGAAAAAAAVVSAEASEERPHVAD